MVKSSIEVIYNQALQCNRCTLKTDENYRETRKGCTGKVPFKRPLSEGIFYTICAGNFYNQAYGQLLDVHRQFRKGILANHGGLLDQPAKYLDVMNLVESIVSEKEIEQLKKSAKNGRK
jgi:hypothetical protein